MPLVQSSRRRALMASRQVLWPQLATATNLSLSLFAGATSILGSRIGSASVVLGSYLEWDIEPTTGTATVKILCTTHSGDGDWAIKVDGVTKATVSLYSASTTVNQVITASFSVDTPGPTTLRLESVGSSTAVYLQQIEVTYTTPIFVRTDADLPGVVDVPPYLWSATSGTSITTTLATSYMWGSRVHTAAGNLPGWTWSWKVWLAAGTHTLQIVATAASNGGIIDFSLDGGIGAVGSIDCYASPNANNSFFSIAGVTVPVSGLYTLTATSTTKNALATDYYIPVNWMQFVRTSAANSPAIRGRETLELYPWMADDASAPAWQATASAIFYGYFYNGIALHNYLEWEVDLSAGSWSAEILHIKAGSSGIAHLLLDGVDQGQADFYAASTAYNQRSTIAFTVGESGLHTLRLAADSKNVSSSNYTIFMQLLRLTRTGD